MKLKRILSGVIGLPIVALILILGNKYVIDAMFGIIALISIHEYLTSFKGKNKPITILAYFSCLIIPFLHVIPEQYLPEVIAIEIILLYAVCFIIVVTTNMKKSLEDIMITIFGIGYIIFFLIFIPLLYGTEFGKYLIWYILIAAWGTDTCAYFVGSKFGKHKFSKVSPKKSIEGCIGGTIGAVLISIIYTIFINKYAGLDISYIYITLTVMLLSVLSQFGDLAASSIKRTNGIKDFGNLIPGHGGMLDRIDSIIFIAPFAYFLLNLIY